jgi:cell division protease FtsH
MAKDNNPTPNKSKSMASLYRYTTLILFISFITGSSSLQEPSSITSSKFNELLDKGALKSNCLPNQRQSFF